MKKKKIPVVQVSVFRTKLGALEGFTLVLSSGKQTGNATLYTRRRHE